MAGDSYTFARIVSPSVGKYVGKMINFLVSSHGMNPNTTTLIGHSLGAHLMGYAAQHALQKINSTIGMFVIFIKYFLFYPCCKINFSIMISGLDPAEPLFAFVGKDQRLSDDDANFVSVIHTNAGRLGISKPIGDYDFYPNGGTFQNGCDIQETFDSCSHSRSYEYLAEQISRTGPEYYAVQCESYEKFLLGNCSSNHITIMGELENVPAEKGVYYLKTRAISPFGEGPNFIKLTG